MSATIGLTPHVERLLSGEVTHVALPGDGEPVREGEVQGVVLAGAFNPLHHGHTKLGAAAAGLLGGALWFELSVRNVDKPPLSAVEIARRAAQFGPEQRLILSAAPTFWQKAEIYPGVTFAIGYDTGVRLFEPKYYENEEHMWRCLHRLLELECQFLVGGRLIEGRFQEANEIVIPAGLRGLLEPIPASLFRADISSTELRIPDGSPGNTRR